MIRFIPALVLTVWLTCSLSPHEARAGDPVTAVITGLAKKVIRAMDLAVQRLQNETVRLQIVQKEIENVMNKLKLNEIYDWSKKQTDLFKGYYDELWRVRSIISYYKRVRDVIEDQVAVVSEYKRAINTIGKIKSFTADEIAYMIDVYAGILAESVRNIDQLTVVVSSFATQMSDAERLQMISQASGAISKNLSDLRAFTNENVMLGLQRTKDATEIQTLKGLYNLP